MQFTFNTNQQRLLDAIQRHLALMCVDGTRRSITSLFKPRPIQNGIYLYGDVGRGKTTLMGHIYDHVPVRKKRVHCDTFFAELHRALQSNDLDSLMLDISHSYRVIWIDELQIYDIATAMLLRRLIPALIKRRVIILMTGNVAPGDFYKNGLNHEQFKDFIPYFNTHFYCLPLKGPIDYRTQARISSSDNVHTNKRSQDKKTHFWLASAAATIEMKEVFESLDPATKPSPFTMQFNHRTWVLSATHSSAAFIDFSALAETTCAFDDYRTLVQTFSTIFVTDVPIFNETNRDPCRRFMAFIDIAYECGAELYISAHAAPDALYQDPENKPWGTLGKDQDKKQEGNSVIDSGQKLHFARTASRLTEIL